MTVTRIQGWPLKRAGRLRLERGRPKWDRPTRRVLTLALLAIVSMPPSLRATPNDAGGTPPPLRAAPNDAAGTPQSLRPAPNEAPNDIAASPVSDVAVTVYRNPDGASGDADLNNLQGFALITETRTVSIPPGESRIRFEGVADGIEPASAILTGLPDGLIEKNHDAKVLSPATLVAASLGHTVTFVRTDAKTGKKTRIPGTLLADADGVVFQANSGEIEALRCSGLPETFEFEPTSQTHATPTLSALVRAARPVQAQVRLSYLARGFDWKADYSAVVAPDGKTMSLGAWVTLANSNSVTFADARTQVVAGKLNLANNAQGSDAQDSNAEDSDPPDSDTSQPVDLAHPIGAECWPRGSTSDPPQQPNIEAAQPLWDGPGFIRAVGMSLAVHSPMDKLFKRALPAAAEPMGAMLEEVAVTARARLVKEERLGDLKLYRVPDRTSVVSRQIKQVRLLDRQDIPVELFYRAVIGANSEQDDIVLSKLLRTKNTGANHLGLSLPAGNVSTFALQDNTPLLVNEARILDTTVNEDVELELGESDDLRLSSATQQSEEYSGDPPRSEPPAGKHRELPWVPGLKQPRSLDLHSASHIDVTNATSNPAVVEISLELLDAGEQLAQADPAPLPTLKNGLPTFRVAIPANGSVTIRYRTGTPPSR